MDEKGQGKETGLEKTLAQELPVAPCEGSNRQDPSCR